VLFSLDRATCASRSPPRRRTRPRRARARNANAERARAEALIRDGAVSQQEYDAATTAATNAREAERAATAELEQARNAGAYANLVAPADGVLMEVSGEVGQVVAAGAPVAVLAHDGEREVEVFVPETRRGTLAQSGEAWLFGSDRTAVATLREVSGAADPVTRTWRARYRLPTRRRTGRSARRRRCAVSPDGGAATKRVPIGAVLDAGDGATIFVVRERRAEPERVRVTRVDEEYAYIETELAEGTPVVALGARLLTPGQAVTPRP
jgi:RND family efflux transporter MFP subunit